jgi:hypothetical protein
MTKLPCQLLILRNYKGVLLNTGLNEVLEDPGISAYLIRN